MTISIPDTLTIDNSGKYILSIRLCPDGLSFSAYNPSEIDTFFYREVEFEQSKPLITSLEDCFFSNEFLTWTYKQVNIVYVSTQYTIVPEEFFMEKQKEDYLSFLFSEPEKKCLSNPLTDEEAEVIFCMDNEIYEFCSRSFIYPYFIHYITPQFSFLQRLGRTQLQKQMYVVLHPQTIDIACFDRGKSVFMNSFTIEQSNDILYYILYVWKQFNMDEQQDRLYIYGEESLVKETDQLLSVYQIQTQPIQIPAETYLLGQQVAKTPLDIIALSSCEL